MLFSRNLIRTFLALLALGALPLSAEEQPVPAQGGPAVSITDLKPVKLERDAHSKLLVAQCTVNGVPCNLIVDTAASHTTFDIKFIKKNFLSFTKRTFIDGVELTAAFAQHNLVRM